MVFRKKGKQKIANSQLLALTWWLSSVMSMCLGTTVWAQGVSTSRADSLFARENYREAIVLYGTAAKTCVEKGNNEKAAYLHWKMAEAWRRIDLDSMQTSLRRGESYLSQSEVKVDTVRASLFNSWGNYYLHRGEVDSAQLFFEKAYTLRQSVRPPLHPELLASLNNLGQIAYFRDESLAAIRYYSQALEIARQNPAVPLDWQGRLWQGIANNYDDMGQSDSVRKYLELALANYEAAFPEQWHSYTVSVLLNLAQNLIETADFAQARDYLQPILDLPLDSLSVPVRRQIPEIIQAMGDLYREARDYPRAQYAYLQVAERYESHPPGRPELWAHLYMRQGDLAYRLGQWDKAVLFYEKALEPQYRLEAANRDRVLLNLARFSLNTEQMSPQLWLGQIQHPEALFPVDQMRFELLSADLQSSETAIPAYQAAIDRQAALLGKRHPDLNNLYLELSQYYAQTSQWEEAEKALWAALDANLREGSFVNLAQSRAQILSLPHQIRTLAQLGRLYAQSQQKEQALQAFLQADSLMLDLRLFYPGEASQQQWREAVGSFYGEALQLLLAEGEPLTDMAQLQTVFHLMEQSKAFLLRSRLQDLEALNQALQPEIQSELEAHQRQLAIFRNRLYGSSDSLAKVRLQGQIAERQNALLDLQIRLERENPDYYRLKYGQALATLEDFQTHLPAGELCVSYALGETQLFVLSIRKKQVEGRVLPLAAAWQKDLLGFLDLMRDIEAYYEDPAAVLAKFQSQSANWYRQLLASILEGRVEVDKLHIIPDGILGYLPFETLIQQEVAAQTDFRDLPYLVHRFPVRYSYSAALAVEFAALAAPSDLSYVGFAPRYQLPDSLLAAGFRSEELRDLPWAAEEVRFGAELFDGWALLGREATEERLLNLGRQPAILHFSMHALLDDQNPLHSRLAFAPVANHGDLQVHEIYNLPLRSQLVVLSACNTGVGPLAQGEGIMSLARAFQYAGCPSLLTSLWVVDDEAAFQIHQTYFRQLHDGAAKAQALQQAKKEFLATANKFQAHPFYWASLIQLGESKPLQMPGKPVWVWVLGGVLLFGLVYFLYKKFS
jgi:CHAT domain-containing protein